MVGGDDSVITALDPPREEASRKVSAEHRIPAE
jgi:hypothetical protein